MGRHHHIFRAKLDLFWEKINLNVGSFATTQPLSPKPPSRAGAAFDFFYRLTRPRGVFRLFRHMVRAVASAACLLALLPWCAARVSAPGLSRIDTTLTRQVDGALDRALGKGGLMDRTLGMAETGIASLRAKVREDRLPRRSGVPVTFDAALAGCAAGYLCGKVVVGDPLFLAAAGAVGSAVATRWPEPDGRGSRTAGSVVVGSAYRGARCVAQLRAVVVTAWRRQ